MKKGNKKVANYVFVCYGKDCLKNGAKEVIKELSSDLKNRNLKTTAKIVKTKCMDCCKEGPTLIINDNCFVKVKPKKVGKLLDDFVSES